MPSIRSAAKWLAVQVEARHKTAMAVSFLVAAIPAWFASSWGSALRRGSFHQRRLGHGQLRFSDLFQLQQEARTILPKLIFILSAAGGHWNIRELMILSVVDTSEAMRQASDMPPDFVRTNAAALNHLELLRPRLISSVEFSSLQATADDRMAYGKCEAIAPLDTERSRASGSAALNAKGRPADAVILAYETTGRRWIAFALSGEVTIRRDVARQLRNGNQLWSRASPNLSSKCGTSSGSSCAGRDILQS